MMQEGGSPPENASAGSRSTSSMSGDRSWPSDARIGLTDRDPGA